MKTIMILAMLGLFTGRHIGHAQEIQEDTIPTSEGNLEISSLGRATLMFQFNEMVIHIDPVGAEADYTNLPKADLILVTHEHGDHLDLNAISQIRTEKTDIVWSESCAAKAEGIPGQVMKNGDTRTVKGLAIEAVPAYNIENMRSPGNPYHPKGVGNGYIVTFGDTRVYIAGDGEITPEMKALENIDVAFLPVHPPSSMSPEMTADAVGAFHPKILYPYHITNTDHLSLLTKLLAAEKDIEVRIRNME
ncbi:MBL fold metallo-hydrolase [Candidatus Latescibacterota bacterium]